MRNYTKTDDGRSYKMTRIATIEERRAVGMSNSNLEKRCAYAAPFAAGVYWASVTFSHTARATDGVAFPVELATQALALALTFVAMLFYRRFSSRSVQRGLAVAAILTSALAAPLILGESLFAGFSAYAPLRVFVSGISGSCLLLFWGLYFVSLDRKTAERTVLIAALFCCTILGLFLLLPQEVDRFLSLTMKTVSPLPFLISQSTLPISDRQLHRESLGRMASFFISRAFVGICLGITGYFALDAMISAREQSTLLIAAAACAMACLCMRLRRKKQESIPLLAAIPVLVTFALFSVYPDDGSSLYEPLTLAAVPILWFSWILLSSVQLSECKEEFGMNEALLSFSEKFVKNIFRFGGALVGFMLKQTMEPDGYIYFANKFSFAAIAIWLAVVTFFFVRLAGAKERGKILETIPSPSEQIGRICENIAVEYDLSKRETEVLVLLAEGHTQAYVCDYYTLSPGTVKSHVSHIYRKLKVHKREEMFDLIEEYRGKTGVRQRYEIR